MVGCEAILEVYFAMLMGPQTSASVSPYTTVEDRCPPWVFLPFLEWTSRENATIWTPPPTYGHRGSFGFHVCCVNSTFDNKKIQDNDTPSPTLSVSTETSPKDRNNQASKTIYKNNQASKTIYKNNRTNRDG